MTEIDPLRQQLATLEKQIVMLRDAAIELLDFIDFIGETEDQGVARARKIIDKIPEDDQ